MANFHSVFTSYNQLITVAGSRKKKLISSRRAVESALIKHFKGHKNFPIPKFYIQGSYKTNTIILKKDNTYDVDLGVYFLENVQLQPKTLQANVCKAVKGHTRLGVQHKERCVRVIYSGEFNIDLPVYRFQQGRKHPVLATKNGWINSDPKLLNDWLSERCDKDGQLIRVIKYFKSWADSRKHKMPSGIALSVWVARNFRSNKRDDVAFINTAKRMDESFLLGVVRCKCPVAPQDNLVGSLTAQQTQRFRKNLKTLIKEGDAAIQQKSRQKAFNIWKQLFPKRFEHAFTV